MLLHGCARGRCRNRINQHGPESATTAAAVATSGAAKGATVGTVFTGWKMGLTVIALGFLLVRS